LDARTIADALPSIKVAHRELSNNQDEVRKSKDELSSPLPCTDFRELHRRIQALRQLQAVIRPLQTVIRPNTPFSWTAKKLACLNFPTRGNFL
jgi:hypothetical protein